MLLRSVVRRRRSLVRWASSSSAVRRDFIQFFKDHEHTFIRSSPVVPFNDPSLLFVNAGMNQFKSVLQNESCAPAGRAVNSQRCVRVGGKHNDLSEVGCDGSHLTMFEMLGSWSFGNYWKAEACSLAWKLLTQQYRLDPKRLFVTYFGGCPESGLPPDLEVRDIWLELGVEASHILPFGMEDNFWEMGAAGPCGPCTEIHYDHSGAGGGLVNTGSPDNVEIWNLVFVQYNRSLNGVLTPLDVTHVDTGMGLERLVAVMNGSTSSFDTDLFSPLFRAIQQKSARPEYSGKFGAGAELDTAYRILADHARMITVCLSDKVFPDQNHRLKYVIRRAMSISRETFGIETGMLQELYHPVAESLGDTFPEILNQRQNIETMLDFEQESFIKLVANSEKSFQLINKDFPQLASRIEPTESYNFYPSLKLVEGVSGELGPELAYKLYESHGMQEPDILKLTQLRQLDFDLEKFNNFFAAKKELSKISSSQGWKWLLWNMPLNSGVLG